MTALFEILQTRKEGQSWCVEGWGLFFLFHSTWMTVTLIPYTCTIWISYWRYILQIFQLARNEVGLVNETMILKEWLLYRVIIIITLKSKQIWRSAGLWWWSVIFGIIHLSIFCVKITLKNMYFRLILSLKCVFILILNFVILCKMHNIANKWS
jgi:hypothetical protein